MYQKDKKKAPVFDRSLFMYFQNISHCPGSLPQRIGGEFLRIDTKKSFTMK